MRIAIDISQIVYEGTGVARYVREMTKALLAADKKNQYVLFGSSLRRRQQFFSFYTEVQALHAGVQLVVLPLPPSLLDLLWNRLHIIPVEWFVGNVDIFWSSDWTQPPLRRAVGVTTIHDLSFLRYPQNFDAVIPSVQQRRLRHAKLECRVFLCDSEATRDDIAMKLGIAKSRLHVVYPGFSIGEAAA